MSPCTSCSWLKWDRIQTNRAKIAGRETINRVQAKDLGLSSKMSKNAGTIEYFNARRIWLAGGKLEHYGIASIYETSR